MGSGLAELFGMAGEERPTVDIPPASAQARLREHFGRFICGTHTFKPGDTVTPRDDAGIRRVDVGQPCMVLMVKPETDDTFTMIRIAYFCPQGEVQTAWVEPWFMQPWTIEMARLANIKTKGDC